MALPLHILRAGLLGCKESQETPVLGREVVSFVCARPDSPRTVDLAEKGPWFARLPAKSKNLAGEMPLPRNPG